MKTYHSAAELKQLIGQEIAPSEWLTVSQEMINAFADATGDHQWIHVDVERAKKESPAKTTIAHGYLLVALIAQLKPKLYGVSSKQTLNYGIEKLRFLSMVPSNSRIRLREELKSVDETERGVRAVSLLTMEIEGQEKPALVTESVFFHVF